MVLRVVLILALLAPVAALGSEDAKNDIDQWWASEALRLTSGNGINSAVSLWRSPGKERAELRIMVFRQVDAVDATAAWLWVGGDLQILNCNRVEASFLSSPGFRSCFRKFPGVQQASTVSRCALDWETSEKIVDGATVELQVDTELRLLKRKRLSARQLAKLSELGPIFD